MAIELIEVNFDPENPDMFQNAETLVYSTGQGVSCEENVNRLVAETHQQQPSTSSAEGTEKQWIPHKA